MSGKKLQQVCARLSDETKAELAAFQREIETGSGKPQTPGTVAREILEAFLGIGSARAALVEEIRRRAEEEARSKGEARRKSA